MKHEKFASNPLLILGEENNIIISGGGTGGHIYPGIAIGSHLKKSNPLNQILFVGAYGNMEMKKVHKQGLK